MMTISNIDLFESGIHDELPLQEVLVHLHPQDNVAIARVPLQPGALLVWKGQAEGPAQIPVRQLIPGAHKVALRHIPQGEPIRRYGQIIGLASQDIQPGDHVHNHNLGLGDLGREYVLSVDVQTVDLAPEGARRTFLGYSRANGQVGTRNYVAVISTVNCSAHACLEIAHHFTPGRLALFPNVDGVIALTFRSACSMRVGGPTHSVLQRTLAGMASHANVSAAIFVGLGCETNQAASLIQHHGLEVTGTVPPVTLSIQECGGLRPAIEAGIAAVQSLLPQANAVSRSPQPISGLMLALQCGGSDGWSGVTANPVVGLAADELVRQGGTVVLAETTEIYGAEHLLTRRAIRPEVGSKLVEQVRWWEEHTRLLGTEIDNNPTFGNKAGGLTTIYEKALGAVAKSGQTPLMAVYDYAQPVVDRGFVFMDSPGYDPVSVTGQVAGGCNLVLFTTGRGSVFGFKPAPSIKIASNSDLYQRMIGDMDLDAGRILAGADMQQLADELLELAIAVASGQPTKSEAQGVGEAEFSPWHLGETL
jgi:altronate hydrolase